MHFIARDVQDIQMVLSYLLQVEDIVLLEHMSLGERPALEFVLPDLGHIMGKDHAYCLFYRNGPGRRA
jgi:hypothetical protein